MIPSVDRSLKVLFAQLSQLQMLWNLFFPQLYQEGPSEIAWAGMTFEELQKRTGLAERTRDEALRRVDSLNSTLRKIETK